MMLMRVEKNNGIILDGRIRLDPPRVEGLTFISHGHTDHCTGRGSGELISSDETFEIFQMMGGRSHRVMPDNVQLLDAGHVVGSKMLLYKDTLYTGDLNTRDRLFIKGAQPVHAKTLIIESTFGAPQYSFPDIDIIIKQVKEWISSHPKSIWFGYPLGKAQMLTAIANDLGITPYTVNSVSTYNKLVPSLKFEGINSFDHPFEMDSFVIIAPPKFAKMIPKQLLSHYNVFTAEFSGWAGKWGRLGCDKAFVLSDHCDFNDLINFVKKVNPDTVFTTHGNSKELAKALISEGFSARTI